MPELKFNIALDAQHAIGQLKSFRSSTGEATDNVNILAERIKGSASALTSVGGSAMSTGFHVAAFGAAFKAAGAAISAVASSIKDFAADCLKGAIATERTATQLKTFTGNAKLAKDAAKQIAEFASTPPFGLEETKEASRLLLSQGTTVKNLTAELTVIGNVASASGLSITTMASKLARAKEIGTIGMRDVRDMMASGIPVVESLATALNISQDEAKQRLDDSAVSADNFKALLNELGGPAKKFGSAMAEMGGDTQGLLDTISGKWDLLKSKMGEPILEAITPLLNHAVTIMDGVIAVSETGIQLLKDVWNNGDMGDLLYQALRWGWLEFCNLCINGFLMLGGYVYESVAFSIKWIGTQFEALWLLLKIGWYSLIDFMTDSTGSVVEDFQVAFLLVVQNIKIAFLKAWDSIKSGIGSVTDALGITDGLGESSYKQDYVSADQVRAEVRADTAAANSYSKNQLAKAESDLAALRSDDFKSPQSFNEDFAGADDAKNKVTNIAAKSSSYGLLQEQMKQLLKDGKVTTGTSKDPAQPAQLAGGSAEPLPPSDEENEKQRQREADAAAKAAEQLAKMATAMNALNISLNLANGLYKEAYALEKTNRRDKLTQQFLDAGDDQATATAKAQTQISSDDKSAAAAQDPKKAARMKRDQDYINRLSASGKWDKIDSLSAKAMQASSVSSGTNLQGASRVQGARGLHGASGINSPAGLQGASALSRPSDTLATATRTTGSTSANNQRMKGESKKDDAPAWVKDLQDCAKSLLDIKQWTSNLQSV